MHSAGRRKRERATGSWSPVMHVPQSMSVCVRDPCDLRCPAGVHLYITGGVRNVLSTCTHRHVHIDTHTHTGKSSSTAFLAGFAGGGRRVDKDLVSKARRCKYKWQNRIVLLVHIFCKNDAQMTLDQSLNITLEKNHELVICSKE